MAENMAKLREKALRLGRSMIAYGEAKRFSRAASCAGRAETVLFRLICGAPHDLGLCLAYGEIASFYAALVWEARLRAVAFMSVSHARAALWAVDRADPSSGDPRYIPWALGRPVSETAFPHFDGRARQLTPESRITAAAGARLRLARLLAKYQPRRAGNIMTPDQLNKTLNSRDKFYSSDEALLYNFHVASCVHLDARAEAQTLAQEATDVYRCLADLGSRYEQRAIEAEEQLRVIQQTVSQSRPSAP